jgi:hypothetical protein
MILYEKYYKSIIDPLNNLISCKKKIVFSNDTCEIIPLIFYKKILDNLIKENRVENIF